MGGQTAGQYRAQFFMWAILGAPLILSNDIRHMPAADVALVTNPEVLAVNQDPDCVMGSLVRLEAGETWIKPLSDGNFAATLLNPAPTHSANITIHISKASGQWGDFMPAVNFEVMAVRDIGNQRDLGHFNGTFAMEVAPQDAVMLKLIPV